jgi:hypothetical protein
MDSDHRRRRSVIRFSAFLLVAALAAFCSPIVVAAVPDDPAPQAPARPAGASATGIPLRTFFADFAFASAGVELAQAQATGIGTRGYGILFGGGVWVKDVVVGGVAASFHFISDKAPFGQSTTGGYKTSTTGIYDVAVYGGARIPSFKVGTNAWRLTAGVNAGLSFFNGRRSISNCVDCDEETLDINGGPYFEPIVTVFRRRGMEISGSYRIYQKKSDVRNMLVIAFGKSF